MAGTLYCSFCGKSQHEIKKLIAGPTTFICDECVNLCKEIVDKETSVKSESNKDNIINIFEELNKRLDKIIKESLDLKKLIDKNHL